MYRGPQKYPPAIIFTATFLLLVARFAFASPSACGGATTAIHDIQGNGSSTPISGSVATVEGIVVGDFQGTSKLRGFFVQTRGAEIDLDPDTSEGIFVFDGNAPATDVSIGDEVRVSGTVHESSQMTQIDTVTSVEVCTTGNTFFTSALTLPVATFTDFEPYEGMAVTFPQVLTVSDNFNLGRFGELTLSFGGRLPAPTNLVTPGAQAIAQADANAKNAVIFSDGSSVQNPDPTPFQFDEPNTIATDPTLRVGDTIQNASGAISDTNGTYKLEITGTPVFNATNARPVSFPATTGTLKVASFSLLNYFNGDGVGGGFPTTRGATTAAELTRQTNKLVSLLAGIDADVYALQELENDDPATVYSAVEELVDAINAVSGAGTYSFIDTGIVGLDEIRNGILYKPAMVTLIGTTATLTTGTFAALSRPPIAQAFQEISSGKQFILVVNHFKSKGSACAGDPDLGDGQGNCNLTRVQSATELFTWLGSNPTATATTNILVTGDFNCYLNEDPLSTLENNGYQNMVETEIGTGAYNSIVFGLYGALSHAFVSSSLENKVTDVLFYHTNAEEPSVLDYNAEFKSANQQLLEVGTKYRASNQDALIVGLSLAEADLEVSFLSDTPDPVEQGQNITYTIDLSNSGNDADSVEVEDVTPANTTFVSAEVSQGTGWDKSTPTVGGTGTVTFTKALMASAETAQFTLVVQVNVNVANNTTISNTVTATTSTPDTDSSNNEDTEDTTVSGTNYLMADDFGDNTQSWTVKKGAWAESGGSLHVTGATKALIYAPLPWSPSGDSTCTNCRIDVRFSTAGGSFSVVFVEGWNQNGGNKVDIVIKEQSDKIVLKQKAGASIVAKGKVSVPIEPATQYDLGISYDGTHFHLFWDGSEILTVPSVIAPSGNVSFKVKNTSAEFYSVFVY